MKRLTILLIAFLLVSCSIPTPMQIAASAEEFCDDNEIYDFYDPFLVLLQEYYDQTPVTAAAPKISMADQIGRLQEIRRNVEGLSTNQCTIKLQSALINAMNNSINGFLALLSGEPDSVQETFFSEGTRFIRQVNVELARLADCLPNCKP